MIGQLGGAIWGEADLGTGPVASVGEDLSQGLEPHPGGLSQPAEEGKRTTAVRCPLGSLKTPTPRITTNQALGSSRCKTVWAASFPCRMQSGNPIPR